MIDSVMINSTIERLKLQTFSITVPFDLLINSTIERLKPPPGVSNMLLFLWFRLEIGFFVSRFSLRCRWGSRYLNRLPARERARSTFLYFI